MIRILQCVNNMHRAGLETMLMNYYRNIDRSQIQFDFLTHRPNRDDYDDEIERLGGKIYRAPRLYPQNFPKYFKYMKQFFRDHPEYQIVHSHIDTMSYLPLLAAKKAGIPVRIAHSHSASLDLDMKYLMKQCFRWLLPGVATHRLACGNKAGQFLFRGKPFEVIPNAVDGSNFFYNSEVRQAKREELHLENKLVIGHVGRFCYPKNHEFLIDVFAEIHKMKPNAVLMLVGTGEKEQAIMDLVEKMGLSEAVLFMGSCSDVSSLYQVMDAFVMPSLFEGVPVVGVEAQFSGLPCIFSDRVTREVKFSEQCVFLSLEQSAKAWAEHILESVARKYVRCKAESTLFDVNESHVLLEALYQKLNDTGKAGKCR